MADQLIEIYSQVMEIRAKKGRGSLWPGQLYKHPFKAGARALGVNKAGMYRMQAGDVILRSNSGKRLWKLFNYGEEDL